MKDREKIYLNEYAEMIKDGEFKHSEWQKFYELKKDISTYLFNRKQILKGSTYYPNGEKKRETEIYLRNQRELIILAYIKHGIDYDEIVKHADKNTCVDFRGSYVDID